MAMLVVGKLLGVNHLRVIIDRTKKQYKNYNIIIFEQEFFVNRYKQVTTGVCNTEYFTNLYVAYLLSNAYKMAC